MKIHSRKTICALFAVIVLLVAGTAWALVSKGIITPDSAATDLSAVGAFYEDAAANGASFVPFTVAGTTGTQSGNLTLPTANALHNTVGLSVIDPPTEVGGRSFLTAFWQTPGALGWDTLNAAAAQLYLDGVIPTTANELNDWGGTINLADGQELILKPATGRAILGDGGTYDPFALNGDATDAANIAGFLRLNGGTTTIYGGNANDPNEDTRNNYNGGLFLINGKLNVAHSNAFGEGHVMIAGGTTLRIFENDTSLGKSKYDAIDTSLGRDQYLFLRKIAIDATRGVKDSYKVVDANIVADGADFTVNSGVREFITYQGLSEADKYTTYGIRLVKSGLNPFYILADRAGGAWHTRGTLVKEGDLVVTSSGTAKYAASLGATWNGLVGYHETNGKVDTGPDESVEVALAAYGEAVASGYAVPYKNYLTIEEGASVTVNRDQFFGQFSGAGAFNVNSWNLATGIGSVPGGVKLPQITIQTDASYSDTLNNNYSNGDFSEENVFSGPVSGTFDLVLNTGYLPIGPAPIANVFPTHSQAPWRKVLKFTGDNNNITSGDTTIVDGILSAKTVDNLPPGSIYVGANPKRNGYKEDLPHTGGFATTYTATLHANGSFETAPGQLVTVGTAEMNNALSRPSSTNLLYNFPGFVEGSAHAGLAADRGVTVSLPKVEVYSGFTVNEEFRVAVEVLNTPRAWDGEVRFSDDYSFPNSTKSNATNVVIDRGVLHLEKLPSDIASETKKGYFDVQINPTGVLSLGADARDFTEVLNVTFGALKMAGVEGEDDERIRVVVKSGDIAFSKTDARQKPAIFQAGHIDYVGLGSGERNRDKRIVIQLDLSQVNNKIAKDTWIKVIESPQAINWNNLHFLRESSDVHDEDYAKIRVAYTNDVTIDGQNLRARLDENTYAIYINAQADIDESVDPGTPPTNITFGGETVATESAISGSVTLVDESAAPVASTDITFELFRSGTQQTAANAIATKTVKTNDSGVAEYGFVPADAQLTSFEAGASYVVKASANGYEANTRTVNIPSAGSVTGKSSGGCDAGFGVFALLAATGALTLLRKKD
jgi:Synergist-CTERM protein sorting domain-containing protein